MKRIRPFWMSQTVTEMLPPGSLLTLKQGMTFGGVAFEHFVVISSEVPSSNWWTTPWTVCVRSLSRR